MKHPDCTENLLKRWEREDFEDSWAFALRILHWKFRYAAQTKRK